MRGETKSLNPDLLEVARSDARRSAILRDFYEIFSLLETSRLFLETINSTSSGKIEGGSTFSEDISFFSSGSHVFSAFSASIFSINLTLTRIFCVFFAFSFRKGIFTTGIFRVMPSGSDVVVLFWISREFLETFSYTFAHFAYVSVQDKCRTISGLDYGSLFLHFLHCYIDSDCFSI